MKNKLIVLFMIALFSVPSFAQEFNLSGEIRPRYENRYGYSSLRSEGDKAGNFISQRSRINFDLKNEKLIFKLVIQNVRNWGDSNTLSPDDTAIAFQQAWGEAIFSKKLSLKLGRQEISYDNERIFARAAWAQQGRSHDALKFKIRPNQNHKIDLGIAYNTDKQTNSNELYSNVAGYKTFQYAWYHGSFNKFKLSFLFLNNGIQYINNEGLPSEDIKVDYSQTMGPRVTFNNNDFSIDAAFYLQKGMVFNNSVSASYVGVNFNYMISKNIDTTLGGEYFSGKDTNDTSSDIKSFKPLFGANHKFNGLMDYFYVGNHENNVGLMDVYLHLSFTKKNWSFKLSPHYFSSSAQIVNLENNENLDSYLGAEFDFTMAYKINDSVKIDAGYSQIFGTKSMEALKGGNGGIQNSWAWVMVTFKPNLLNHKFKKLVL